MFDESELKVILQRAMELDSARSASVTRNELLQVAAELGISESAVNQAMAERETMQPRALPNRTHVFSAIRILNVTTGIGIVSGTVASGTMFSHLVGLPGQAAAAVSLLALAGLVMMSGGLALTSRLTSLGDFIKRNTATWLGAAFGWTISAALLEKYGVIGTSLYSIQGGLATTLGFGLATTVVGLAYHFTRRAAPASPATGSGQSRRVRVALWLRDRISDLADRWSNARSTSFMALRTLWRHRRRTAGSARAAS